MTLRIYYSSSSDALITDDVDGLATLRSMVETFLRSEDAELAIDAEMTGSAAPYDNLLPALRFSKSSGLLKVTYSPTDGVRVAGSIKNIRTWAEALQFPKTASEGDHHHPEARADAEYLDPLSLSTIVEVRCSD